MSLNRLRKFAFRLHSQLPGNLLNKVAQPRAGEPLSGKLALVFSKAYQMQVPYFNKHPFDTLRFSRTFAAVMAQTNVHPDQIYIPKPVTDEELELVHSDDFIHELNNPKAIAQYLEWPFLEDLSIDDLPAVTDPFRHAAGGTLLAAQEALLWGASINIGGGFHHAKPRYGEGFCLFADIPIAIRKLRAEHKLRKTLVVDLDVHQGNGTVASLDPEDECYTFSMHQEHIYPFLREESDLDIELEAGTGDAEYMRLLSKHLPQVIDEAEPEMVFYVAGCDPLSGDPLASLELSPGGILARDNLVISTCAARSIPVVMTLAGGYRHDVWQVQADSIANIISELTCQLLP